MNREIDMGKVVLGAVAGVVFLATLTLALFSLGGFYQVRPGEAAALQIFGAARAEPVSEEGLHWHWPSPIGRTTVLQVRKNRTADVGFQTLPDGRIDPFTGENWQRDPAAATMITGDLGLLETHLVAHYYISDLNDYLFRADDPGIESDYFDGDSRRNYRSHPQGRPDGQSMQDALEIAVRRAMGQRTIDDALVRERELIERETQELAQEILDSYGAGLTITSVQLQEIRPPKPVQAAFDDVLRAREEREKKINDALTFENSVLPKAEGEAVRLRENAAAYRAARIAEAQAEADRFLNILREYEAAPEIIATRMYLETMDKILPKTRQVVVAGDALPILMVGTGAGAGNAPGVVPIVVPEQYEYLIDPITGEALAPAPGGP